MRFGKTLCCAAVRTLSLRSCNIHGKYVAQFTGSSVTVNIVVVVYVSSFPVSRGSKTLRPDLVSGVARGAKEANSTFYEWRGAANVASGGKI